MYHLSYSPTTPVLIKEEFIKYMRHMQANGYHFEQDPYASHAFTLMKPFYQSGAPYEGKPSDFMEYNNIHDDEVMWPNGGPPFPMYLHVEHLLRTPKTQLMHQLKSSGSGEDLKYESEYDETPTYMSSSASLERVVKSDGMFPRQTPIDKKSVPGYRTHDVHRKEYQVPQSADYQFKTESGIDYWIYRMDVLESAAVNYLKKKFATRQSETPDL